MIFKKNKMTCNILLTAINSSPVLNIISYLRKQKKYKIKIIGCDITSHTAGRLFVDRFYEIPKFNSKELLPVLVDICKKEKVNILIPNFERELLTISENREFFENIKVKIALPSKKIVRLCLNKEKTLKFFLDNNIPTCRTYKSGDINKNIFPLFLKPKSGDSSRGAMILNNVDELKKFYNSKEYIYVNY